MATILGLAPGTVKSLARLYDPELRYTLSRDAIEAVKINK